MKFEYVDKIEEMSEDEVGKRIRAAMDYEIADKIVPIPYVGEIDEDIKYSTRELTAKCPMTGQRDFYKLSVSYVPNKLLPELKSLRKYLAGYDDLPISHEHLAAKVYKEFKDVVKPKNLSLKLSVAVRGGIKTTIKIEK